MWHCGSAHTRLTDSLFNDAMRIVTAGCLRSIPTDFLPILTIFKPAELRRQGGTLSQAYCSLMNLKHLLYLLMVSTLLPTRRVNATRSTLKINQRYAFLFQDLSPGRLAWVFPYLLGWDSTAFALALEDSSDPYTNGDLLLQQSLNVAH